MPDRKPADPKTNPATARETANGSPNDTRPANTPPSAPSTSVPLPARVGRYEVRQLLGEGAFGRVYLAYDPDLDRQVAIKIPKAEGFTPDMRDRFIREARATATIHHPNVCPVFDVGTDGALPYIVMHYQPGTTLDGHLKKWKVIPPLNAVALVQKLALGMAAAHEKGVVHRDLKPHNILFEPNKQLALITDFGLARFVDREASMEGVCGTPLYMSPEQARGKQSAVGPHSDVYSLGVILFRMLTGDVPFRGTVYEILQHHVETPPPPPSSVRRGLDPRLDALVLKAMAKNPADRYPSARAFAEALGDFATGRPSSMGVVSIVPSATDLDPVPPRSGPVPAYNPAHPPVRPPRQPSGPVLELDDAPPARRIPLLVWAGVALFALTLAAVGVWLAVAPSGKKKEDETAATTPDKPQEPPKPAPPPAPPPEATASGADAVAPPPKPEPPKPTPKPSPPPSTPGSKSDPLSGFLTDRIGTPGPWATYKGDAFTADFPGTAEVKSQTTNGLTFSLVGVAEQNGLIAVVVQIAVPPGLDAQTLENVMLKEINSSNTGKKFEVTDVAIGGRAAKEIDFSAHDGEGKFRFAWTKTHVYMIGGGRSTAGKSPPTKADVDRFLDSVRITEPALTAAERKLEGEADFRLGLGFASGKEPDYPKVKEWYEKAAAHGHSGAQNNLGVLYEQGKIGWRQDFAKAKEWYERAALQDDANAQCNLGALYHNARGVERDYAKAKEWYEKAAQKNDANALFNLGLLYEYGLGVPKDVSLARGWYEKAVARGHTRAKDALARLAK